MSNKWHTYNTKQLFKFFYTKQMFECYGQKKLANIIWIYLIQVYDVYE